MSLKIILQALGLGLVWPGYGGAGCRISNITLQMGGHGQNNSLNTMSCPIFYPYRSVEEKFLGGVPETFSKRVGH